MRPSAPSWLPAIGPAFAALMWLPQAALLAWAIGGIADGAPLRQTAGTAVALLVLGLLRAGLDAWAGRVAFRHARAMLTQERQRAVTALAAASPIDTRRPASGLAASVIAEQGEATVPDRARFAPARVKATVVPLVIVAAILPLSWLAALLLIVAAPVIPLFMALIGWRAKAASEQQLQATGGINGFLLDRLRGLPTLRALGAVERTAQRLRQEAEGLRQRTMAVLRIAFLSSATLELFAALGVALTAGYIGLHLLGEIGFGTWGGRLSLAEGMFILLLAPAVFEPLRELAAVWHDRAAGQAALNALRSLAVSTTPMPAAGGTPVNIVSRPHAPAVVLHRVTFTHAGADRPALSAVDLAIAAGSRVALFSPSGGGKTTMLALMAGLAAPQFGEVLIDGTAMTDDTAATLRSRIAWIGQRPHFCAGSLRANVAFGRAGIDQHAAGRALARCGLPADRQVGEDGAGLSGGEALRLALARAIADPCRGLLLADEPTAHLDRATAQTIADLLVALSAGKTLIVATHDPLLAARMDRVVELVPARQPAPPQAKTSRANTWRAAS